MILRWFPGLKKSGTFWENTALRPGEGVGCLPLAERSARSTTLIGRRPLGKTHIKKVFFLVVGPLRFYPPYTNGLVVHDTFFYFFFSLIMA